MMAILNCLRRNIRLCPVTTADGENRLQARSVVLTMTQRRAFTATDVPLVGGILALDFVNTAGARSSEVPRERLHTYGDLLVWLERVGALGSEAARSFSTVADEQPGQASEALQQALTLREDLFAALAPLANGNLPDPDSRSRLQTWLNRACGFRKLSISADGCAWTWRTSPEQLDSLLWPIVGSADDAVIRHLEILKQCGECDWLFLDTTKNSSRQWCKKLCGDRVRARRHYRRRG